MPTDQTDHEEFLQGLLRFCTHALADTMNTGPKALPLFEGGPCFDDNAPAFTAGVNSALAYVAARASHQIGLSLTPTVAGDYDLLIKTVYGSDEDRAAFLRAAR